MSGSALAAGAPDLVVTSAGTTLAGTQATGSRVTFKATVKNQGTAGTPPGVKVGVAFKVDGKLVNWSDTYTSSVAPGASVTLTANSGPTGSATWTATVGNHTLRAQVDDVNRIAESTETNNVRDVSLAVANVKPVVPSVRSTIPDAEYQWTGGRNVTARRAVPAGQPAGVRYTVIEHWGPYCQGGAGSCWNTSQPYNQVAATTGTSAAFDIFACASGGRHDASCSGTYLVSAQSVNGGPQVFSSETGLCEYTSFSYEDSAPFGSFINESLDCAGQPSLASSYDPDAALRIDAGSPYGGWAADRGFTGGATYTRAFAGLDRPLSTPDGGSPATWPASGPGSSQ